MSSSKQLQALAGLSGGYVWSEARMRVQNSLMDIDSKNELVYQPKEGQKWFKYEKSAVDSTYFELPGINDFRRFIHKREDGSNFVRVEKIIPDQEDFSLIKYGGHGGKMYLQNHERKFLDGILADDGNTPRYDSVTVGSKLFYRWDINESYCGMLYAFEYILDRFNLSGRVDAFGLHINSSAKMQNGIMPLKPFEEVQETLKKVITGLKNVSSPFGNQLLITDKNILEIDEYMK